MSGRAKKSAQNIITGFANQVVTLVLSFVSRSVFIHTLGLEYLGMNGIFADVLNLLSMADLGFNTTMAYSFYKPLAEHDEKKLAGLIQFYKKIYTFIALAVTTVGIAVIPFLKYIINTDKQIPNLVIYYLFSLAGVVISYLFVYKTTILTADQRNYEVTRISIWTNILKTVLQIIVLLLFKNYILYLAIGVIIQYINNLIASRKATKYYPYIENKQTIDKQEEKDIFKNMKSVFLYKISTTVFTATDNILISVIVGTAMVGVYSNYLMVSSKLLLIMQIIFSALTASIGNLIVKEKSEKRYEIFSAVQSVSFILCGVIVSVFCLMSNDLVKVWLGGEYLLPMQAILAISLNTYLSCVLQPLWSYRDATGLYMKTKYIMLIAAILNIVLSIVLGQFWGVTGIVLASAIARLSTYFWYEPKILFKEYFERKVGSYYLSMLGNLGVLILTVMVCQLIFGAWAVDGWFTLICKGIAIGGVCGAVFLVAYCRTEGFKVIWNKVKGIFSK